ncbi:thiamine-phosphate diphosphorylase [Pilibacter termitis]|uniref:Thiamine-phosphate synthase n=1 Tax=Pilibacter termitis TaxID=263852 RepID=A0A1T4L3K8_9ENTE|nr:thiamine phosphate synthase [Pilibacter termitis]SJZ49322.1 thiamine-phosphate diphosphorylase [Pilibacter termitis]
MKTIDYSLYLVTDRSIMSTQTIEEAVEKAILGGVSVVQLREKNLSTEKFITLAKSIHAICQAYQVPLIINDNLEVMQKVNAEGLHIGQDDLDVKSARAKIGQGKILGVSAQTLKQAQMAEADGADYLGVGAMVATETKKDARIVTKEELSAISQAVNIPVVAIGGVNLENISTFKNAGADGFAIVSAILKEKDIQSITKKLKQKIGEEHGHSRIISTK